MLLCLPTHSANAAQENLVRNASFEDDIDKNGVPDHWENVKLLTYGNVAFTRDAKVARTGKSSLSIPIGPAGNPPVTATGGARQKVTDRGGGKAYEVSVYAKASKPTRVRVFLYGHKPRWGDDCTGAASREVTVGESWTKITHRNTFAPDITRVYVLLVRQLQKNGGAVWFDDVEVKVASP